MSDRIPGDYLIWKQGYEKLFADGFAEQIWDEKNMIELTDKPAKVINIDVNKAKLKDGEKLYISKRNGNIASYKNELDDIKSYIEISVNEANYLKSFAEDNRLINLAMARYFHSRPNLETVEKVKMSQAFIAAWEVCKEWS